ncbi:DUF6575 domain-containing protein [Grimontia hollisae]|uniref:DUF6575 domain-containing protein n=1 Tax=Grimontia hollisae TaxID=673 RepID=UPI00165EA9AB|nr:DUF6575 domain-containing protein [Grimontia hollisae]
MNILPRQTLLGHLDYFEIYDDFDGPKCFSVKNDLDQLYLVYWSGDYEERQYSKWVYMPVSQKILDELVRQEITFHNAFKSSKRLMIVTTPLMSQSKCSQVEVLTTSNRSTVNLPPIDFSIEIDEIQSIAPESKWDFNLKIAKKSGKSTPDRSIVSKVLDSFSELIEALMTDSESKSEPKVFPITATYGSFDVKFATNSQQRAEVAVEQLGTILSDVRAVEEKLLELNLDPYRLKNLLDIVNLHKLELTLKPKTSELLERAVKINSDRLLPVIQQLEESPITFVDSQKVPQANNLDRVIDIVKHRLEGGELRHEFIEGLSSYRQVRYYVHAAWCLGLLHKNNTVTAPGRILCQKKSKVAQYQFLADRLESSDFGWAWMKWAGVSNIADLEPQSAERFITECVKGLKRGTIPRRATSLSSWLIKLQEYRRDYDDVVKAEV